MHNQTKEDKEKEQKDEEKNEEEKKEEVEDMETVIRFKSVLCSHLTKYHNVSLCPVDYHNIHEFKLIHSKKRTSII